MLRVWIVAIAGLFAQLFLAALNQKIGLTESSLLIAPSLLVLAVINFKPEEALGTVLLFGFFLDAWMGAPLGLFMTVLALLWALNWFAILWLGQADALMATVFIFVFSLAFRVSIALALGIAGGSKGNFGWTQIFVMPLLDVMIGLVFYRGLLRVLTLLGLCELREDASQRVARRSSRIRLE
jgi:ABC-type proline/glycine betaine transport system permease subunit